MKRLSATERVRLKGHLDLWRGLSAPRMTKAPHSTVFWRRLSHLTCRRGAKSCTCWGCTRMQNAADHPLQRRSRGIGVGDERLPGVPAFSCSIRLESWSLPVSPRQPRHQFVRPIEPLEHDLVAHRAVKRDGVPVTLIQVTARLHRWVHAPPCFGPVGVALEAELEGIAAYAAEGIHLPGDFENGCAQVERERFPAPGLVRQCSRSDLTVSVGFSLLTSSA